jgi:hypothetical protein
MGLLFANHAKTTIVGAVSQTATVIRTSPAMVAGFPDIVEPDDYFYASFIPIGMLDVKEIVRVNRFDKSTGEMEVVRGVDGTISIDHPVGTGVEIRIPNIALQDILSIATQGVEGPKLNRFNFPVNSSEWVVEHGKSTPLQCLAALFRKKRSSPLAR